MGTGVGRLTVGAAVGAALAGAGGAEATPVVVTKTVNLNNLLSAGGSDLTGTFNINGLVPGQDSGPFNILSGTVSAFGFSDASYDSVTRGNYSGYTTVLGSYTYVSGYTQQITGYYTYSYRCGWLNSDRCYASAPVYGNVPVYAQGQQLGQSSDSMHVDSVADQIRITAGGDSATGTATATQTSTGAYGTYAYTSQPNAATTLYDRFRDTYSAIDGETDAVLNLGATALASLASGGTLDYAVSAPVGHTTARSVVLSLVVDVLDVAEPASAAVLLAGIAGMGAAGARRRRARAAA